MMHMTFYWGRSVTILFDCWKTDSWVSYFLSLLSLFLLASFYQYLEDRRIKLKLFSLSKAKPSSLESPLLRNLSSRSGFNSANIVVAGLFGINSTVGYMLMLAVMSFNGGVFIAVVAGLMGGYLLFRSGGDEDVVALENPCACS